MKRIGLTGSIGSGKSTVSRLLVKRDIPVLDADQVAREVSTFPDVLQKVSEAFGPEYVTPEGFNRPKIAELVFHQPEARQTLNGIIHPRVRSRMRELEEALQADLVVQDIPLLFESNLDALMDATIVVDAPLEERIARVMARDGLSREQVLSRDNSQMPAAEKRQKATYVVFNDGSLEHLETQVNRILDALLKSGS
ncbi:dephospho-CoA kinase [Deinococcus roseus]|uniref:Dephospho-CoA kinase n=1 Tax=Deinococcus roseus TaxID=392414 RepID=A0ABQ2CUY9_9DEIO|nr:dephospho-CoA kinase [Deinococcus roseus]GGJ23221.1 dephospho-CoA kinase [Deinococcus roseus]